MTATQEKEAKALAIANSRKALRSRLMEAKAVLIDEIRKGFGKGRFDFEQRQLVGDNGYILQWKLRNYPDRPESYENQQTNRGIVVLLRPRK